MKPPVYLRTADEAVSVACKAKGVNQDKSRACISVKCIVDRQSRSGGDTLLYVVNIENDGYVLVSAPTSVPPVLGVVDNGEFEMESNESFGILFENIKQYVRDESHAYAIKPIDKIPTFYYDTVKINSKIPPRISVMWNQYWPENIYAPNYIAGCGPVALVMTLSYFESPKSIALTYPNADMSSISLDWKQLKQHKKSSSMIPSDGNIANHVSSCANMEMHETLGRLTRQLGVLSESEYKNDGTYTGWWDLLDAAKGLLPDRTVEHFTSVDNFERLNDLIRKSGIIIMDGSSQNGGHLWVVDGVMQIGYRIDFYESSLIAGQGYVLKSSETHVKDYWHINWGYGGSSNGYFLLGIFDSSKAYQYDSFNGNTFKENFYTSFDCIYIK